MEYLVICTVALIVAALTLFSGFGLGTLLLPAFAIFFPVSVAVASTAVVHLANNIFKVILMGKKADLKIVARFAIPAAIFAVVGALLLNFISGIEPVARYTMGGREFQVTVVKLVIAGLIAFFAVFELTPRLQKMNFDIKYIPFGGALSGFFGGLSGHQGALRTAFLVKVGLEKEVFIGTMVVSAVIVDVSRLVVYGVTFFSQHFSTISTGEHAGLIVAGCLAAFLGSFIGTRLLKKVTMKTIQLLVGVLLLLLSFALGTGLV